MVFREAQLEDIKEIMAVRMSVTENRLNNPALVTEANNADYLTRRGKGWVCEVGQKIIGFAIVDLVDNNVWALFLRPEFVGKGIGRQLHGLMMEWYFQQTDKTIWLGTAPGTKAEAFYQKAGWQPMGLQKNGEVRFEMSYQDWMASKSRRF